MAYDLEEQEQLAALKGWWKDNGGMLVLVLVAAAITVAGWRGWQWYQSGQATQAGALYEQLAKAALAGDAKAVRDASGALIEGYPRTLYASMGALTTARFFFQQGDLKNVKAQLGWVIEKSKSPEFRDTARLRLAAVLLDEKAYDPALKTLEAVHTPGFEAEFSALRGDILVASGKRAEAKTTYQAALEQAKKQVPGNVAFQESVRMRLEAVGG